MTRKCGVSPGDTVIVGLSGGSDSVALTAALVVEGYKVQALHANFHLRGDESDRDARCAAQVASRLAVCLETIDFDVAAYRRSHPGVSVEMACRELRYDWFSRRSAAMGNIPVAIAHHRDDNIETLFLNLVRGTGISGLRAMRYRAGIVVRPMLDVSRSDVADYIASCGLPYVVDSSNLTNDYRRNQLRNDVLPALYRYFPGAPAAISRTIANLSATEALLDELSESVMQRYIAADRAIELRSLVDGVDNATTLLYWWLRHHGFNMSQCCDMVAALDSDTASGQTFLSGSHRATLSRGRLTVDALDGAVLDSATFSPADLSDYPLSLSVEVVAQPVTFVRDNSTIYLDFDAVVATGLQFTLRPWRQGDAIRPFGMKGRRLVSDIFTDAHLSVTEKQRVNILTLGDDLLWVVGMRASRLYPVTPSTTNILTIRYKQPTS